MPGILKTRLGQLEVLY